MFEVSGQECVGVENVTGTDSEGFGFIEASLSDVQAPVRCNLMPPADLVVHFVAEATVIPRAF
jgi:hypothetical protein